MKAIFVREHGDASVLRFETIDDLVLKPGYVRVAVRACSVNHLDIWVRKGVPGHTFPLPLILGSDVSGVVSELGAGVDAIQMGAEVVVAPGISCGHCQTCLRGNDQYCQKYGILGEHKHGGYADYVCVPRSNLILKPKNLSFAEAASVGVAWMTAWHMVVLRAELKPHETILIQAAGSGVGSAALQIATWLGARVIATVGSEEKAVRARALGATHVINYNDGDVFRQVKKITEGAGAHVVFEHVGASTWASSMRSLAWQGRLVTCGATSGAEVSLDLRHVFFKSLSVLGSTMGRKADLYTLLDLFERGIFKPTVDRVMPFSAVQEAHALVESRSVFGKIVLSHE